MSLPTHGPAVVRFGTRLSARTTKPRNMIRCEKALDGVILSVGVDHADIRVPARGPVEIRKDPEEMRQEDPVHAAVADDEDRLARALAGEAIDGAERPREDFIERLPTRPRDKTVVAPARQAARLIERLSGPVAHVDFPQLGHHLDRDTVALRDHLRGVAAPREIARDDAVELHLRELIRDRGSLLAPARGQRRVGLSGEDAGSVALALAVAHEVKGGRLH